MGKNISSNHSIYDTTIRSHKFLLNIKTISLAAYCNVMNQMAKS